ncbi:uncharacterized protein LOC124886379 [Capsicum annuum]|uniref:uncharacterized protein LOC124886379 n=1 Tax=Capsicum annuum TaxID=4072 RepID=UPI001FB12BCC|nr:uncharacterized protein LOC124886379 [Capsicum annuum]
MVITMNLETKPSKKVMSFWMVLESYNFNNVFNKISTFDEKTFKNLYDEAETALSFLESNSPFVFQDLCPITSQFLNPILDEFFSNMEKVNHEVSLTYDAFCCGSFDNISAKVNLALNSKLNSLAKEWDPSAKATEIHRSLFMTFTRGNYSGRKVRNYFQRYLYRRFGADTVQDVHIFNKGGAGARLGLIVFKNSLICAWLMQGEAKYSIGSGYVWLKKYEGQR